MKIAVVGTGYVGLVTGVSLAELGHEVVCVGRNKDKIKKILKGSSPFFEPGLNEDLKKLIKKRLFSATDDLRTAIEFGEIIIVAVGTPTVNGRIDLSEIKNVSRQIGEFLKGADGYKVIAVKSTVSPGTTQDIVKPLLERYSKREAGKDFGLVMNPEFLREGNAMIDARNPDRIIIGQLDKKSGLVFSHLYKNKNFPTLFTNLKTAELTKYASNALFATLISYSNEIGRIAEAGAGIDVLDVWRGVHLDKRLSPIIGGKRIKPGVLSYILSGCGYGGSCFPKDTKALAAYARDLKLDAKVIKSVIDVNKTQPKRLLALLKKELGSLKTKRIAVLGLSFKPNTDDIRESPATLVIEGILAAGARVIVHDPRVYKNGIPSELKKLKIVFSKNVKQAITNADGAILITSWEEYENIDPKMLKRYMKNPLVIDGRRFFNKDRFEKADITYRGIGYSGKLSLQ